MILQAYQNGCIYDAWTEHFQYGIWEQAFRDNGVDMDFYLKRERGEDELFPWDFIDIGVAKQFLLAEYHRAKEEKTTPNGMCWLRGFEIPVRCLRGRKGGGAG